METIFDKYKKELDPAVIENDIRRIQDNIKELLTVDYLKRLFGFIDLTSLNTEDDHRRILSICDRVNLSHTRDSSGGAQTFV